MPPPAHDAPARNTPDWSNQKTGCGTHTDLAGVCAFFADEARLPPPPGLPSLRAFQQAQADAVVSWLRDLAA